MKKKIILVLLLYANFSLLAQSDEKSIISPIYKEKEKTDLVQITPKKSLLCSYSEGIQLQVNVDPAENEIFWYHRTYKLLGGIDSTLVGKNTDTITAHLPGEYYVLKKVGSKYIMSDTAEVNYNICDKYSAKVTVNSKTDPLICTSNLDIHCVAEITDNSDGCSYNPEKFLYRWDFGDSTFAEKLNLTEIDHKYEASGDYITKLTIIDSKKCEKTIKKVINIFSNLTDTVIINYDEIPEKDIELDFADYSGMYIDYYKNNQFFANTTEISDKIIPYNENRHQIIIPAANTKKIKSAEDIAIFIKLSTLGKLNLQLQSPDGKFVSLTKTPSKDNNNMYGHPAYHWNNYKLNETNSYIISTKNEQNFEQGEYSSFYFSPDKYAINNNFEYIASGNYKSAELSGLEDAKIEGKWTLSIKNNNNSIGYGKLYNWGIILKKSYYQAKLLPDSMVCIDQFLREYDIYKNKIHIKNAGTSEYRLICHQKYNASRCRLLKNVIVKIPEKKLITKYFSPNGDNINDYWTPISPEVEAEITIFDKTGKIVANYQSTDKPEGWDGTRKGKPLPADSYWYIIKLKKHHTVKGVVTIIR